MCKCVTYMTAIKYTVYNQTQTEMVKRGLNMGWLTYLLYHSSPKIKLENCVCKTQVMPPCPKLVLNACPTLTHDPQLIQSILETNV